MTEPARRYEVTDTSLVLPDDLNFADWFDYGRNLDRMSNAVMWWLGDWWAFGADKGYGQRAKAVEEIGLNFQTCRDAGWIARRFRTSDRSDIVPWVYHRIVARLDAIDRNYWITRWAEQAKNNQLPSQADVRAEISRFKRDRYRDAQDPIPAAANITLSDWHDWLPVQPDCDLLLTDPPYMTDVDDIKAFTRDWLPLALRMVKPTGRAYVCIGAYPEELWRYLEASDDFGPDHLELADVLCWTYRNMLGPTPSHDYRLNWQAILYFRGIDAPPLNCPEMLEQFTVQDINAPDGRIGDRWHTWQKPDLLAERFIRHATQPGDIVLDPFAGTGTFVLAAARLGRKAYGCEINPAHLQIAIERGCSHA